MIALSLAYDMRAPDFGAPPLELYRAALDQCEWADKLGFQSVNLMEHHASTDGYLPSPIVMAAAIAARTERMLIRLGAILLPLYHPLRAAEDLAVLDLIAEGRLRITVGAGYREEEFAQFGLRMRRRPSLVEEGVETLKRAWTGEPFEFRGETVRILPRPAQRPRPEIFLGGASPASAKRAARIADGYQPIAPQLMDVYREELAALGKPVPPSGRGGGGGGLFLHVSEDPERDWAKIAPHALHETNDYGRWTRDLPGTPYREAADAEELRASGAYQVVTPDECLELARSSGGLGFKPLMGGLDPELAWESLHLFERKVLPQLRAES